MSYNNITIWIREHLKAQEMCNEAMRENLFLVPDHLKMQDMCNEAVEKNPWQLIDVEEICIKAFEVDPWQLVGVPNHFKT